MMRRPRSVSTSPMTRTTTASSARTGRRPAEDVAQEGEVRLAVMGVVEGRVDGAGVEPEEPRPQPVVVAVLDDPQVRRRGHDEPRAVRSAQLAQGRAGAWRDIAGIAEQGDPFDRRRRLAEQPVELGRQAVEHVAFRRGERGPGREVADVARRHAERVGHQLGQVARALAVEDAGDRGGEEPVGPIVEVERASARTGAGASVVGMERERDLARDGLRAVAASRRSRLAGRACRRVRDDPSASASQRRAVAVPGQAELGQPGRWPRPGWRAGPWRRSAGGRTG